MGKMIDGLWYTDEELAEQASRTDASGAYQRAESQLRHWIGEGELAAEAGRYHLYVAYNCPWAHRTLIMRAVKGLQDAISVSFVSPKRTDQGWVFDGEYQDDLFGHQALHQLYQQSDEAYTGRVTVPVLWDKTTGQIVSNESADIVRMLSTQFDAFAKNPVDTYPEAHRSDIDKWNALIHTKVNNGVYRAGFASSQEAYDEGVTELFETLEQLEAHLAEHDYLAGEQPTEADWRLLPTLVRFDVAYYGAFKCNVKRLVDYPNLWAYAKQLYHYSGIKDTVRFDIYKQGYYSANPKRNPLGIVPLGPNISWE